VQTIPAFNRAIVISSDQREEANGDCHCTGNHQNGPKL